MKLYVNILAGETAAQALPILATADPSIVGAAVDALVRLLQEMGETDSAHTAATAVIPACSTPGGKEEQ